MGAYHYARPTGQRPVGRITENGLTEMPQTDEGWSVIKRLHVLDIRQLPQKLSCELPIVLKTNFKYLIFTSYEKHSIRSVHNYVHYETGCFSFGTKLV